MSRTRKQILLLSCLILLLSFSPIRQTAAQAPGPWVNFSPDPSFIYIDGTDQVTVDVMVRDADRINWFDLKVEWDNTVVTLLDYQYDLDEFLIDVTCVYQQEGSNFLQVSCGQLSQPDKSGTGPLIRLTFQKVVGITEGVTTLDITQAMLARSTGYKMYPGITAGTLNVVDPSNFIYLPLIMNVSIQGVLDRGGIDVALARGVSYGMGPYSGTSTNTPGENLLIEDVVVDTYRITTNHPRVLNVTADLNKTFTLAAGANTVPALRLIVGNAAWTDNEINIDDYTAVCGAYGDPNLNPDADVNFDGLVDLRDLALVAGNWGLTSQMAYAAWLP